MPEQPIIPLQRIDNSIVLLRGEKVILSTVLAPLYGVAPPGFGSGRQEEYRAISAGFYVPVVN